jgi:hypothetical protein
MPKWWPWGRSRQQAPEPAPPVRRAEPAWQRLPAIQRTIGEIDSTTRLSDFTASLTTSGNPGVTGSLDLLAADHPERLPVLDAVRDATTPAAQPSVAAPARQSRTWSPSPAVMQRALHDLRAPVQRAAEADMPTREIHPVQPESRAQRAAESLMDAPQPPAERVLDVISDPGWEEPPTAPAVESTSEPSVTAQAAQPASVSNWVDESAPPADHSGATTPAVGTREGFSPTPHLSAVQRAVTDPPTPPRPAPVVESIPVVRPMDSRIHRDDERHPAPAIPVQSALPALRDIGSASAPADSSGAPLQRTVGAENATVVAENAAETDDADDLAAGTGGAVAGVVTAVPQFDAPLAPPMYATASMFDRVLPVVPALDRRQPAPSVTPVAAQRATAVTAESRPKPTRAPDRSTAIATTPSPVRVQRLPVVGPPSPPTVSATPSHHAPPMLPTVQRSATAAAAPAVQPSPSHGRTSELPEARVPVASQPQPALPPTPTTAQRLALPAVESKTSSAAVESPATQRHIDATPVPVAQRMTAGGRLVILPPVRSSRGPGAPTDPPQTSTESVLFESRPPMSLQRMFEHTAAVQTEDATGSDPGGSAPTAASSAQEVGTRTITFPTVQREPEPEPASPSPPPSAPAAAETPAAAAAPAAAPQATDVEEMVNRLYDPLAARLRAELWLDRERAGALMDLGR